MLKKFLFVLFLIYFSVQGQHIISGKMIPVNEEFSWVALYQLKGSKQLFVKNSILENGSFSFELPNATPNGMYRMRYKMDNVSSIDFIFTNENISLTFDPIFPSESLKFITSEENILYNSYLQKTIPLKQKLSTIQMAYFKQSSENDKTSSESLYVFTLNEFTKVQQQFEEESAGKLANHFIKAGNKYFASLPIKVPQEYLNSEKKHFFDFIDFNDSALLNSTFITESVINYILYFNVSEDFEVQNALYKNAINEVIAKLNGNDVLKSDIIITLLYTFSQTENVAVMNYLKDNYYDSLPEIVKQPVDIKRIFEKVKLSVGKTAPDFAYEENDVTKTFHQLDKASTYILAFWSTSCSHCVIEIPELYEFTKNNTNIHVVDVGLEKSPEDFQIFAEKHKNWTNVLGLGKWENPIGRKYDIVSTPTYFILDANKKIIAKPELLEDVKAFFKED